MQAPNGKTLVSFERYTVLLNEELKRHPDYHPGLHFEHSTDGFELRGSSGKLSPSGVAALSKAVDDAVSQRFTVAAD